MGVTYVHRSAREHCQICVLLCLFVLYIVCLRVHIDYLFIYLKGVHAYPGIEHFEFTEAGVDYVIYAIKCKRRLCDVGGYYTFAGSIGCLIRIIGEKGREVGVGMRSGRRKRRGKGRRMGRGRKRRRRRKEEGIWHLLEYFGLEVGRQLRVYGQNRQGRYILLSQRFQSIRYQRARHFDVLLTRHEYEDVAGWMR